MSCLFASSQDVILILLMFPSAGKYNFLHCCVLPAVKSFPQKSRREMQQTTLPDEIGTFSAVTLTR